LGSEVILSSSGFGGWNCARTSAGDTAASNPIALHKKRVFRMRMALLF
jgi:hypothetical protein